MHDGNAATGECVAGDQHGTAQPYAIGYGRPPKATRFKPGQSGNPKGRPKGRSPEDEAKELLLAKVPIIENGQRRYVSRFAAVYLALWQNAMKGNTRAIQHFLALAKDLKLHEVDNVESGWTDEMFRQLSDDELEQFIKLEEKKQILSASGDAGGCDTKRHFAPNLIQLGGRSQKTLACVQLVDRP